MSLFVVAFAAVVVGILAVAALVLIVMIAADVFTAWPSRAPLRRTPGAQLWVRSVETDTVAVTVITPEGRWVR